MKINELFQQAQQFHQQGKLTEAEKLYRQITQNAPQVAEAKHLLGILYSQQGRHKEGANWVIQAIQKQPAHPPYYNNLGLIYYRMQDYDNAFKAYRAATKLAPRFAEAWFNLANTVKAQGNLPLATQYFEKTIKIEAKHGRAMYNLGTISLFCGRSLLLFGIGWSLLIIPTIIFTKHKVMPCNLHLLLFGGLLL